MANLATASNITSMAPSIDSGFPVYDQLLSLSIPLTDAISDWSKICATINSLSIEHTNFLCALIFHHYRLEMQSRVNGNVLEQLLVQYQSEAGNRSSLGLPYGGQTFKTGRGIVFTVNNLPIDLQRIITNYVAKISQLGNQ